MIVLGQSQGERRLRQRERWHLEGSECDLEPGTKACDGAGQGLWWRNTERSRDQEETSDAVSSGSLGTNVKEKGQLDPSGGDGFERAESHRWGLSVLPVEGVHMETFLSFKKNLSICSGCLVPESACFSLLTLQ